MIEDDGGRIPGGKRHRGFPGLLHVRSGAAGEHGDGKKRDQNRTDRDNMCYSQFGWKADALMHRIRSGIFARSRHFHHREGGTLSCSVIPQGMLSDAP